LALDPESVAVGAAGAALSPVVEVELGVVVELWATQKPAIRKINSSKNNGCEKHDFM